MSVVLVATKKVKVLEYVAAVEAAGLDAVVVDLDAFAIQNQFELSSPGGDSTDAVALIDIGASVMKTNVIHAGACIFARDVPFGGNNYTDAIAQRLNVSTEMHMVEHISLTKDGKTLVDEITMTDPKTYTKPHTIT